MFSKAGWPLLGVGLIVWLVEVFTPGFQIILAILAAGLIGAGVMAVAMSFFSAHSEGVESSEKERKIRDRSTIARCLYLEGSVPDGKGKVGRCRLYEFDLVDLPYCVYCREYVPVKGSPEI